MRNKVIAFALLFTYLLLSHLYAQNRNKMDSLLVVIRTSAEDTNKAKACNRLAFQYGNISADSVLYYTKKGFDLSVKLKFLVGIGNAYNNYGNYYSSQAKYNEAVFYFLRSKNIYEHLGADFSVSSILSNIGKAYLNQALYPKALEYQLKSLKMREAMNDKGAMAICNSLIGTIYWSKGSDYKNTLYCKQGSDYYKKALSLFREVGDNSGISNCYNNLGIICQLQGDITSDSARYKEALEYFLKSVEMKNKTGDKIGLAVAYANIGSIYLNMNRFTEALEYQSKALAIKRKAKDIYGEANSLNNIGLIYFRTGKKEEAINYYMQSLALSEANNMLEVSLKNYEKLSNTYASKRNFEKAFEYHHLFKKVSDSIINQDGNKKITQLEMKYDFDKKEEKLAMDVKAQALEHKAELSEEKIVRNRFIAAFAVLLVISVMIFINFLNGKKARRIISAQKLMVENQMEMLEEKQKDILDSIHYAKRIQKSLLPTEKYIERNLNRLKNNS